MTRDLDEPVHLVPYDPNWPQLYQRESESLRALAAFSFILAIKGDCMARLLARARAWRTSIAAAT